MFVADSHYLPFVGQSSQNYLNLDDNDITKEIFGYIKNKIEIKKTEDELFGGQQE